MFLDRTKNRDKSPSNTKFAFGKIFVVCLFAIFATVSFSVSASAETRSLKLYYIHTKEKANIVYKKNGRYVSSGLKKINRFLRDWRRNEPTKMDPALLDLVWEAYRKTGSRKYIHVVSAYRSPATNAMLRKTRGGQAKKSQHMLGKAMDFYIPGVSVKKLREIGFKIGGGGVGYYPRSGVPFVHLDTGNVRSWPRMSRSQLTRLFPKGGTLHLPTDGKPLPGYKTALAKYKARKSGRRAPVVDDKKPKRGGGNLLASIFGGGRDEEEDVAESKAPVRKKTVTRAKPVAKPKPIDTPRTLLASLPRRALPVPTIAPRTRSTQPSVPVALTPPAPVAAAPQTPVTEPQAPAIVEVAATPKPVVPTYEIPVPNKRPAVLIARADAPINRRSAQELEAAINSSLQPAAETVVASAEPVEPPSNGSAAIAAAIEAADNPSLPSTELAYALPIPAPSPNRAAEIQVASLPTPGPINEPAANIAATEVAYAAPERDLVIPSPRPVARDAVASKSLPSGKSGRVIKNTDQTQTAALDPGIPTTPKTARPTVGDTAVVAAAQKPKIVPADQIDQSRFGSWTTTTASLTDDGRVSEQPNFIQNATRAVPNVVYTAGFSKDPPPSSSTFSGNAVTFLAVAKFDTGVGFGANGRGEPLQIRVPN